MKKLLPKILICCLFFSGKLAAQSACTPADATTATRIAPSAFPYTSPGSGVTVSARRSGGGVYTPGGTFSCSGTSYTTPGGAWYIGTASTDSIIVTFSKKVTNFSLVLNISNPTEIVSVIPASGSVSMSNYCTAGYALVSGTTNRLECVDPGIVATMVTINNPDGAYEYYITHNGIGSACLVELLDCITAYKGPANIVDGIQLWLDGSDVNNNPGTNPANGTKIPVWKDISGHGNNATVLSGQDTAKMHKNQINGKDVMQFTKGTQFYGSIYEVPNVDIRATAMPQSTIFTVYRPASASAVDWQGIWGCDNGGWDRFFMSSFGSTDGIVSVGPPTNNVTVPAAGTVGATKLLTAVYHSGVTDSSVIYFNALPVSRVTDNTHLTDAQTRLRIGWDGDDNPFTGDIAEMVVYNRKLSDCEIKAVNRYFGYKYGVNLSTATITPSAQQYFCPGDSVALKGSGGDTYTWLKGATLSTATLIAGATDSVYKAITAGNYYVIAARGGCSDTSVATVVTEVPATIYVDSSSSASGTGASWATAKKTLTEALNLAHTVSCPVQIWVKKGTYYPTSGTARDSSFRVLRNNIKIYGGFAGTETLLSDRNPVANPTLLSGDIGTKGDSTDNSYHIMTIVAAPGTTIDTNVVLDGFTFLHANASYVGGGMTINGQFFYHHDAGAIYNVGYGASTECSPLINNCAFRNNTAYYGSALYNGGSTNGKCNPVVRNSVFEGNYAHSNAGACLNQGRFGGQSSPVFTNCTFTANGSPGTGGAFYSNGSSSGSCSPVFTNCAFTQNYSGGNGGAVFSAGSTGYTNTPVFNSCTFTANTTVFGSSATTRGGALYNSNIVGMEINNCLFSGNSAVLGGGAIANADASSVKISNTIFSGNTARSGGALQNVNNSSTGIVVNDGIFTGNTATGTSDDAGGAATILSGTMSFNSTTFSNNSTASTSKPNGSSISTNGSTTLNVTNTVIWGTAANHLNVLGTANYTNSLLKGLTVTFPNISTDPLFVNATDPDGADNTWRTADDGLYMLPCSGAINGGLNSALGAIATDIAGATRILFTTTDMGAYEHNFDSTGRPRISIAAAPGNKICAGDTAYFDVTVKGAGSAPLYQWYKNGVLVSSTATYGSTAFANNDSVWVVLTNTDCALKDTSKKVIFSVTPPVIYVDSSVAVSGTGLSWTSPYKTVSEALNLANYGSTTCPVQIWVKKGTYYPGAARDSSFRIIRNNIKLYGGFAGGETLLSARSVTANPTILSGDIGTANDSTDNCYHVMTIHAKPTTQIDTNTVVDGFTITRGTGQSAGSFTYNGITYNRQDGGGIHIWGANSGNKCNPLIANCTFTRNSASFGGAIYNAGFNSGAECSPVFRNNTFSSNKATSGGGVFNNGQNGGLSSPVVANCTFSNNTATNGGGLYNQATGSGTSDGPISNTTFNNNKATNDGGAFYMAYGKPVISNCRFYQNDAGYSGGSFYQQGGKSTFNLNIFDQNSAQVGGAIRIYTGDPSIMLFRNVFYRNTSSVNDAGAASLVCANGNDTIMNNLFVQNKNTGSGANGGGAVVQEGGTSSYIINNTFYADSSTSSGGALHFKLGGTNRYLLNNIFYKSYNGSSATDYNTASGTTVTTESNNLFSNTNPRFVRESNPMGADGIWLTADDGLDLLPCSPAVNAGTTAPAADIRNRTRVSLPDIGAYEEQGKPLPVAPTSASPVSYCQGATPVALSATRSSASDTLKWYDAAMTLLAGPPTPSTTTTGTFTWYVSQTDSTGCESAKTTINVVIKPTPVAPVATTPVVYCQGVTASALTATLAAGSDTLKWYDATMTPLAGAPTPSTTTTGTFTYYVSQKTSLNCEGPKTAITVQVNPTPGLPTATTPIIYCQNAPSVALSATPATAGDTLKWYNSIPAPLSSAPIPSTLTAGAFTFYVSGKNSFACEGAKKAIVVQVNPTPIAPPSPSPVTYCQDDAAVALTATKASSSDTLKWYDAALSLLAAAPVPSTVSAGTTIYYVSAKTSLGCEGPKTTINVVVNPRPAAPVVVTPINACVGVTPPALTATGTNLKWYTAASGGTGTTSLVPSVSAVGSNTYYVTQTNTFGCESLRESLTVNVRPSPVVTLAPVGMPAFVFCVGDSIAIKASSATATSYEWKNGGITIPGSVSDTLHINTTATYSVIARDMYGCADTEAVYVMQNPLPRPKLSPVDVTICKGVSIVLYATPATAGYKYEWFKDGVLMGVDTALDKITVDSTGFFMVRMRDIYNCTVNTNGSSVSQYPEMIKPVITRTGSILKLSANYASYQWYRNGKVITGATAKTYTIAYDGDYHVVVLDANGCESTSAVHKVYGLGIGQAQAQGGIRVYPNPTLGKVIIEAGTAVQVIVNDITGREVLRKQQTTEVDLEPFADGVYMLRIFDQEGHLLQNERINKQTK